jgi:hypothetical protein
VKAKAVLMTAPAYAAADIVQSIPSTTPMGSRGDEDGLIAALSTLLRSIKYPPVAAVVVVYPDSAFKVSPSHPRYLISSI